MGVFLVRFLKTVVGDHGDQSEQCQWWAEVTSQSKDDAEIDAIDQFCAGQKISHWKLRADRMEVLESDFPS